MDSFSRRSLSSQSSHRFGFTLIELLVVIAIIAILSVVVILTLNPAELLRQSRDSNRLSDLDTLNHALGLYSTDQSASANFSMGSSSVVYLSLPDPSATSTAGNQCQGISSLPTLATTSGWTYHCAASSTYRNTNGTGWIPVNLTAITSGSPLGNLPIDPTNISSRLFYTYTTNGTQYEVTAAMESAKYKEGGSNDAVSTDGGSKMTLAERGNNLSLEPLDNGDPSLVVYWPLNEGSGTIAYDLSGDGINATWSGGASGTTGYYSPGQVGAYSGTFNGSSTNPTILAAGIPNQSSITQFTFSEWVNASSNPSSILVGTLGTSFYAYASGGFRVVNGNFAATGSGGFGTSPNIWVGAWNLLTFTEDANNVYAYVNGSFVASTTRGNPGASLNGSFQIGNQFGGRDLVGSVDDIRIYNRALSATEIQAIYNAPR